MTVLVRAASPDEWRLVRDVRRRALATDPDAFGSALSREEGYDENAWRGWVRSTRAVLALLDDEPVGLGGVVDGDHGAAQVVAMWVEPSHRGAGIGTTVLADVLARVPAGREVRLWVAEGNAARRVYERAGFVATGGRAPIRPGSNLWKDEMVLVAR